MPWIQTNSKVHSLTGVPQIAAVDPTSRITDFGGHYEPLEGAKVREQDLQWPRATVRSIPGPIPGDVTWYAILWEAWGVPVRTRGLKLTKSSKSFSEVFGWAAQEVGKRRPKDGTEPPC